MKEKEEKELNKKKIRIVHHRSYLAGVLNLFQSPINHYRLARNPSFYYYGRSTYQLNLWSTDCTTLLGKTWGKFGKKKKKVVLSK